MLEKYLFKIGIFLICINFDFMFIIKMVKNMKNRSIWINNKVDNEKLPKLDKDILCDVIIIGGGMAGLSVAYHMMDSNMKTVLIERDKCGMGATSKNTGKLTWMQDLIYSKLSKNYNSEVAKLYLDSQVEAIDMVKKIVSENKIECHLTKTKSYVFSYNDSGYSDFASEIEFYKNNNVKYKLLEKLPIDYPCKYAIETNNSYVFNPYEYLVGLKKIVKNKIDIYENTRCISVDKDNDMYVILVDNGFKIRCKYVVVASHYPMFIVPFFIPFKTRVDRFFLGVSKSKDSKDIQMISHGKHSISMRYYQDDKSNYLVYGRRSHSITSSLDVRDDYKELNNEYEKYFGKEVEYFYHIHDLMTYDCLPFIGSVSKNLFICTGFNKWGNTNGTLAGMVISDIINKRENRYVGLFNPKRGLSFDKIKNLFIYNIEVGSRYIINKICSSKSYYGDDVKIKFIHGKRCGVYTDKNGDEHVVSNICPHMKCNLVFNYIDKTWDCPCHASRFDCDGNIIYGPSVYNIKLDDK